MEGEVRVWIEFMQEALGLCGGRDSCGYGSYASLNRLIWQNFLLCNALGKVRNLEDFARGPRDGY